MRRAKVVIGGMLAVGLATTSFVAGKASATPGAGVVSATILNRSTLYDLDVKVKWDDTHTGFKTDENGAGADLVFQRVEIAPGGTSGWHTHPGPVFATIQAGTATMYDSHEPCEGIAYPAGSGFIDEGGGHVHKVRNEGTTNVVLYLMYVAPQGAGIRIDAAAPAGACH